MSMFYLFYHARCSLSPGSVNLNSLQTEERNVDHHQLLQNSSAPLLGADGLYLFLAQSNQSPNSLPRQEAAKQGWKR